MIRLLKVTIDTPSLQNFSASKTASSQKAAADNHEWETLLKRLDECQETEAERAQRKAAEEKAAQIRRERNRKAAALQGRIAQLRSRIMTNKDDKKAFSELSMAKTQLYWLTNAL